MSLSYDDIDCKASMKSKGEITADNCGLSFFCLHATQIGRNYSASESSFSFK